MNGNATFRRRAGTAIRGLVGFTLGAASAAALAQATAQNYPNRPVRIVVGYAAGGPVDNAARKIQPYLQKELGQPVVIENRGGAGGVVGSDFVAKAEPDGYVLVFTASPTQTMSPHLQKTMPFDPLKDYTPVSMAVGFATALLVNKDLPVRNVAELVAYAKANPKKVSFGSAGIGASNHLSGELLKKMSGAEMLHIPYKGNALALTDVIGAQLTMMFNSVGDSLPFVKAGQVRALAVTSKERSRVMPDVPTMIEAGMAGFDVTAWYALEGPPKMPRAIVNRLNTAVRNALGDPALSKAFTDIGYDVMPSTPEELAQRVTADYDLWKGAASGLKVD